MVATTLNPLPASPALAASIAVFNLSPEHLLQHPLKILYSLHFSG